MNKCEVEECENEQEYLNGCECGRMVCDECLFSVEEPTTCAGCD